VKKFPFFSLLLLLCLLVSTFAAAQTVMEQWQKSKHADRELVVNDVGVWELRQGATAFCGRCHDEQGFKAWVPQLMKGDPGILRGADGKPAGEAYIKELGMTKADARPVTCAACHSRGTELRIKDSVPMLPNGVAVSGVGKGALCMACHNTRNGRIVWDSPSPKQEFTQPHDAAQADVILGKNVYFYNDTVDSASPHALFTGDACVSCHKTYGSGGHAFKPGECATCHGEKVSEPFVQKGFNELHHQLGALLVKKLMASKDKVGCVVAWDEKADKETPDFALDGKSVKEIAIKVGGIHGQIGLEFTTADGKQVLSQMGNIKTACAKNATLVWPASDPVVRGLYNWLVFQYDGSRGVHNPRFSRNVLMTTLEAMSK
jgi:cytochrome c553